MHDDFRPIKWMETTGGPFVVGELSILSRWRGTKGSSLNNGSTSQDLAQEKTDYERACDTKSLLDKIACYTGEVLLLGDEPLRSGFLFSNDGKIAIVRWVYATIDFDQNILGRYDQLQRIGDGVELSISSSNLGMMDASIDLAQTTAEIADYREDSPKINHYIASANVSINKFYITEEKVEDAGSYSFIVHRFLKK